MCVSQVRGEAFISSSVPLGLTTQTVTVPVGSGRTLWAFLLPPGAALTELDLPELLSVLKAKEEIISASAEGCGLVNVLVNSSVLMPKVKRIFGFLNYLKFLTSHQSSEPMYFAEISWICWLVFFFVCVLLVVAFVCLLTCRQLQNEADSFSLH